MKKPIYRLLILSIIFLFNSCDNDDNNNPNLNQCNFAGLTVEDSSGNISTQIAEANLRTDYFPNNGGPGIPGVEVFETTNPGNIWITTDATTLGAIDTMATIGLSGTNYACTVTCQRAGTMVGEEFRFDIVIPSLNNSEAELCVIIDIVAP
jgi:hypothetical protein